jgi:hypothetical protein
MKCRARRPGRFPPAPRRWAGQAVPPGRPGPERQAGSQRCSCAVAVLEVSQDKRGPGNVTDLARAGGDVPQGAPAAGEQREPPFAQAAQGALDGVAGAGIDVEFPAAGGAA